MTRYQAFQQLLKEPHYKTMIATLPRTAMVFILSEIEKTMTLDYGQFSDHVRNLFLGMSPRPASWAKIDEILMACNSKSKEEK